MLGSMSLLLYIVFMTLPALCGVLQAGRATKLGPGFAVQMLQEADELGLQVIWGVGGGGCWWVLIRPERRKQLLRLLLVHILR